LYTRADTFSPAAGTSAISIIAQIAAAEGRHLRSLDIRSAYLKARIPEDDPSKLAFKAVIPIVDVDPSYKALMGAS
jgi:hypothetical protein